MTKLVGMLSVLVALSLLGFFKADEIQKRYAQLRLGICMLDEFKIWLEYGVMTRTEIFDRVFLQKKYLTLKEENLDKALITQRDANALAEFYSQFGKTDLQGQLSYLNMTKELLTQSLTELKSVMDNKCKLYRTSGILAGIFVCIILI